MKHKKNIARIIAFALLVLTMIGSFIGCKNAAGGYDGPYLTGVYVDAPYPEESKESFRIALLDFEGTPGKVQCYWFSKSKGEDLFFNSRFMAPVDYEINGNKIIFKDVVLSKYPEQGAKDYTGTYDGATDTVGMPNEFIDRGGTYTFVKPTTEDYFTLIPPLSDKSFVNGPFDHVNGAKAGWFMEHDAVNKTMQLYFVEKEQEKLNSYAKFGKMENGEWVASPASYEDTGKGTLRFKNVWVFETDAPVDFEITYGKYEGITLPNINAGFGGYELFLSATDKNYLNPNVSWE